MSTMDVDKPVKGELRKQSPHLGVFRRRNVILTSVGMQIYDVGDDEKAISILPITADTIVSDIKLQMVRGNHGAAHPNQAVFQVFCNDRLSSSSGYRPRIFGGSTEQHFFSAETLEEAQRWKSAIEARAKVLAKARDEGSEPSVATATTGDAKSTVVVSGGPSPQSRRRTRMQRSKSEFMRELPRGLQESINLIQKAQWREVLTTNGLRILAETAHATENPVLLISCVLPASPDRARRLYYNFERRSEWDNLTESVQRIDTDDEGDNSLTLHCKLRGQKVGGLWVAPRDYVVDSTWRAEDDGSVVILETTSPKHNVPESAGYVRSQIYSLGITLCPRRRYPKGDEEQSSAASDKPPVSASEGYIPDPETCLLQMAVHANVGGWLSKMPLAWSQHWLYAFMLRVIGFREVLEADSYESVDFIDMTKAASKRPPKPTTSLLDMKREATSLGGTLLPTAELQPLLPPVQGTLPRELVYSNDESFNLRSKTYLQDKKKMASSGTMFELIAMDLWEVDSHVENVAANMKGGLADKYLNANGPKPFLFIVQFQVPGPPLLSFIAYFAARPGVIENLSPFSRLFADFIDGTDAFRDSRFKFIPRVVKGSYVVKSAVGSTPCLLGNKLDCSYHRGDGYFEIDIDVGSSSVAGSVLRVVKGYITALTIDLCFLLEAQDAEELPEEVLGSLRFERLSLDMAKKWTNVE